VIYLSGAVSKALHPYLDAGTVGMVKTPNMGNVVRPGWIWAADNGCFNSATYVGDDRWFAWLEAQPHRDACLFATAPDVVGDHQATLARSLPWLPKIQALGYPAAFVLQDGATVDTVPWGACDWVFVGGTDHFKLVGSLPLIRHAKSLGKQVHVGRVNSGRRFARFASIDCDSADGTYLAFGLRRNLPNVLGWMRDAAHPRLFEGATWGP
jgi:hypothetical protein